MIPVNKVVSIVLLIGLIGASSAAAYYYRQQGTAQETILQDASLQDSYKARVGDLTGQITTLNKQIDSLNSQISSLQSLNNQLGGNNSQLISQIRDIQATRDQLQSQVSQLQSQIGDLTEKLKLQQSRVIANGACTFWDCPSGGTGNQVGNLEFISLGSIPYAGYVRVSWSSSSNRVSFTVEVYDVNVTTPIQRSGIFSIPVAANATGNVWFTSYDCQPVPAGTFCPPVTFSITYWY